MFNTMKYLIGFTLLGTAIYFIFPYVLVGSILLFDGFLFEYIIDTAFAPSLEQWSSRVFWIIRRFIMSDEAVDIYPLTVEEYESADEVAQDVEVE